MKHMLLLAIVLVLAACGESPTSNPAQNPMTDDSSETRSYLESYDLLVAFYNVDNLFDTIDNPRTRDDDFTPKGDLDWDTQKLYEKIDHIAEVLNSLKKGYLPDIVGLCEVENRAVLEQLIAHRDLSLAGYAIAHFDSGDQRGIDNALLYRKEVFEVSDIKKHSIDDYASGRLYSREILQVSGRLPNGEDLNVFVNHWPSRRDGPAETEYKRTAAAKTLRAVIGKIQQNNPEANILACGDFNAFPTDASVSEVLGAGPADQGHFLTNLALPLHNSGQGTISYKGEWNMFDQMMVSEGLLSGKTAVRKKRMRIAKHDFLIYKSRVGEKPNRTYAGQKYVGGYSDHLPIYLEIRCRPE